MKFPQRWVHAMTHGQIHAAWHGVYRERARDYRDRAAVLISRGNQPLAHQLMGYARESAANARR